MLYAWQALGNIILQQQRQMQLHQGRQQMLLQARQFLDHADTDKLKVLFVAHISQQNNSPELADAALEGWPGLSSCAVIHATQESGFDWHTLDGLDQRPEIRAGLG